MKILDKFIIWVHEHPLKSAASIFVSGFTLFMILEGVPTHNKIARQCIEQHGVAYYTRYDGVIFCHKRNRQKYYKLEVDGE